MGAILALVQIMEVNMPQTVRERIYEAFFVRLANLPDVRPETVEQLKGLYAADKLSNKRQLGNVVQNMEDRYAQDQDADR